MLARKVYRHGNTRTHFQAFAWACISQQWQLQDVLLGILNKLVPEKREIFKSTRDEELVNELYEVQQRKKCLLVLDDIWSMDFWDILGAAFPPGNTGSKILLTTRNHKIALHIDPTCFLHKPRCLNEEESWELLQRKVFHGKNSPDFKIDTSMEMLGRELVVQCGGLPLAVTILGGLLVTKPTLREWKMVHENFNLYLWRGQNLGEYGKVYEVLALSYRDLAYQLKPCFLYLGNFPEDSNIRTRNLYQMWAAEGFLPLDSQHRVEGESIMDVAEHYLCELAQRGMVQVQVEELSGKFKSCQLHDLMRDVCLSNGKEENFLKIIHFRNGHEPIGSRSSLKAATTAPTRRLSVFAYVYVEKYFPPKHKKTSHVRSVLFSNRCTYRITILDMLKLLCKDFKLLRVLQLDNFRFRLTLSKAIGDLVHLRYLSFQNSDFIEVPSSLSNLKFLQTLDLEVKSINSLTIPDVLWKLDHLRHL
ncbi:Disease resistance protein (CC-NBS-LRR class) family [Forsythia ovata]|uniref:Disease resistance protein (CC-NBS-LRR class) family n=1 Tax=Forsythia ovata TaxID=205694 RepID=A0ABD1PKP2_9LAMI